jgi:hypothetical protein
MTLAIWMIESILRMPHLPPLRRPERHCTEPTLGARSVRVAFIVMLLAAALQVLSAFSYSSPSYAFVSNNPLKIDFYIDPDNFIDSQDNGSIGDATYSAFCGANRGAWIKTS